MLNHTYVQKITILYQCYEICPRAGETNNIKILSRCAILPSGVVTKSGSPSPSPSQRKAELRI